MMMMLKMQQEQAKNRMSIPPGGQLPPRGMGNPPEVQRVPVSQQGNMPVMINLQGHGAVPPSPDKARGVPLMVNPQVRTQGLLVVKDLHTQIEAAVFRCQWKFLTLQIAMT